MNLRKITDKCMKYCIFLIGGFNVVIVFLIFLFILTNSIKAFESVPLSKFFFGRDWISLSEKYGLLPLLSVEDIINAFDVKVKETSIMAIARFQPAASDLRSLITFIESSKMLERMGDLLLDTLVLMRKIEKKEGNMERDFGILENFILKINDIFQKYLEAFIEKDEKKAYVLLGMDEEIN